jgi:tetratricopeptide (TPR) repeat protein
MVISIWIGYGVIGVVNVIKKAYEVIEEYQRKRRRGIPVIFQVIPRFSNVMLLILLIIPFVMHYGYNNRSKYYIAYDFGLNILEPLKNNAIVITKGDDDLFPLWYMQRIEYRRVDVIPVDKLLTSDDTHTYSSYLSYINENQEKIHPIYVYHSFEMYNCKLVPVGVLSLVLPDNISSRLLSEVVTIGRFRFLRGIEHGIINDRRGLDVVHRYITSYIMRGRTHLMLNNIQSALADFKRATMLCSLYIDKLKKLYTPASRNYIHRCGILTFMKYMDIVTSEISAYYGLGMCYQLNGNTADAKQAYNKVLELSPGHPEATRQLHKISG